MELKVQFQTKDLARKIGRRAQHVPLVVMKIIGYAEYSEKIFAPFAAEISAQEARKWLTAFARGVQYIHEAYDHAPAEFIICHSVSNEDGSISNDTLLLYEGTEDKIVITFNFIIEAIKNGRGLGPIFGNLNTPRGMGFAVNELATLSGVEEAYHSYQTKVLGDRYTQEDKAAGAAFMDAAADTWEARVVHYRENPIERGVRPVIEDAIRHFGFDRRRRVAPASSSETGPHKSR